MELAFEWIVILMRGPTDEPSVFYRVHISLYLMTAISERRWVIRLYSFQISSINIVLNCHIPNECLQKSVVSNSVPYLYLE